MSFVFAGNYQIFIDHTEVNENQSGKGLGKMMIKIAVCYARDNGNYSIMSVC